MIEHFAFRRVEGPSEILPFDCGDHDLNDFFSSDALNYQLQLLAVTYTFVGGGEAAAFFSVLNDRISMEDAEKGIFNRLRRKIPNKKRLLSYPAVKVGRLGVSTAYQRKGIGTEIMDFIKAFFVVRNKTGCRFITVDSYNCEAAIKFYERNGFSFLTEKDKSEDTRSMYFDLKTFVCS